MFEAVSVSAIILAPGACGMGVRSAVLDTTSGSPPGDLAATGVASGLATSAS